MRQKNPKYMKEIEEFVDEYYSRHHKSPSCREIAENTTLQRSAVQRYLVAMNDNGMIQYDGQNIRTRKIQSYAPTQNTVGVIGRIPCGTMMMELEEPEQYVDLPTSLFGKGDFYLLHADGDSMEGAGIDDGDLVLIRKQTEAHHGDIVVAYLEGEGNTLKTFHKYGRTVFLHPENPKYTDMPARNCQVQGVAVWVFKNLGNRKI